MRKLLLTLAVLCGTVSAWAQTVVTAIDTEKVYTLECRSGYAHSTTRFIADNGSVINGQSATPTYFSFEAGETEGTYYIKSVVSSKYLNSNADGTSLSASTTKSTAWVLGTVEQTVTFKVPETTRYLNNNGTASDATVTGLQANNHPSGPNSGNACSTWQLCEYNADGVTYIEENGNTSINWTTGTWTKSSETPEGVTAVESTKYPDETSDIHGASTKINTHAGRLKVTLNYTGGSNRIDILGVDLANEAGDIVAQDYHFGFSGNSKENNVYTLSVEQEGTYTVRYWVTFCTEANTSSGTITLNHTASQNTVTSVEDLSNNAVYTLKTSRGWLIYNEENPEVLSSTASYTNFATGNDNTACQWAIYKSEANKYYMYNIGSGKFVGTSSSDSQIPFVDYPTNDITIVPSTVNAYPLIFSVDGTGTINHYNHNAVPGVANWGNSISNTDDAGSAHEVFKVGEIDETILATITAAVEAYETKVTVIQELGTYLDNFYASYYDGWGSGWRNQPGVNNYSQPEGDQPINEAYDKARTFYEGITDETTIEEINAQKTYLQELENRMTINQPESNSFYRVRCVGGGTNYLSSETSVVSDTDSEIRFNMVAQNNADPNQMFLYNGSALLSYTQGLYINTHAFNTIGTQSPVVFTAAANGKKGQYNIQVNSRYIYGRGNTKNNHIDSGTGTPTNANELGYNWWLEEVTSLPFTFKAVALGFATFNAPVAVELPEGISAYIGELNMDNNTLQMYRLDGNQIPANTAVLLRKEGVTEDATVDFTIVSNAEEDFDGVTNSLVGTVAAENLDDTKNCYSLQKSNTTGKVGFYSKTTGTKGGFKAWVETEKAEGARVFTIIFDGEDATGIKEALGLENENVEIYDLSGRRLDKPAKGVNIIGGKTVIVR